MTSAILDEEKTQRRGYSKNGCRECKRRKIKCDEGKPSCWQCVRLKKTCSYPCSGERIARISKRKLLKLEDFKDDSCKDHTDNINHDKIKTIQLELHPDRQNQRLLDEAKKHSFTSAAIFGSKDSTSSIVTLLNNDNSNSVARKSPENQPPKSSTLSLSYYNNISHQNSHNLVDERPHISKLGAMLPVEESDILSGESDHHLAFNQDDLNILANDLNNIVSDIMLDAHLSDEKVTQNINDQAERLGYLSAENIPSVREENLLQHTSIPKRVPFDHIKVTKTYERLYLEQFYHDFSNTILPFSAYDEVEDEVFNPARDILFLYAAKEPFLLAAILAQGAKTASKKNHMGEDEEAHCVYLSRCLKLLEPALKNTYDHNDKKILTTNIEAVLLTVLLLTTADASNPRQNWRPHLKGAKDLLLKYTLSHEKVPQLKKSKVLIFCKYWFVSLEILAGLSTIKGGILTTDEEFSRLLTTGDAYDVETIKEIGVVTKKGFNLLCGYDNECILPFRELIKIKNHMRQGGRNFRHSDSLKYINLLSMLLPHTNTIYADETKVKSSLNKNDYLKKDFVESVKKDMIEPVFMENSTYVISWMDVSNQLYALAAIITVFTECFEISSNSPQVQSIVEKMISLIDFIGEAQDNTFFLKSPLLAFQWPMLVAGMNCCKEEHKFVIMKLFRMTSQYGAGGAQCSLKRVSKRWKANESTNSDATESDSDIDAVTY